ncbi:MAG: ExbD/TolR family protein [Acidobacteriota bacterium]
MKLGKKRDDIEIPTASMADIAFLLIVFFMVTTVFSATKGLDFKLPKQEDEQLQSEDIEGVFIKVHPGGAVSVDRQPMELDQILPYLQPKLERWPDKPVILYTDPDAVYANMMAVYDVLNQGEKKIGMKVRNIAIPTQKEIDEYTQVFGYNPFEAE